MHEIAGLSDRKSSSNLTQCFCKSYLNNLHHLKIVQKQKSRNVIG